MVITGGVLSSLGKGIALASIGNLVEFIELPKDKHEFFARTQAHPELKSCLTNPAPLFRACGNGDKIFKE